MTNLQDIIPEPWKAQLKQHIASESFEQLNRFVNCQYQEFEIFPPKDLIFNALKLCPVNKVKILILGQDPYHGPNQANGLAFSVPKNFKLPPSLRNIFKELQSDLNIQRDDGDISDWAKQGVLLLNTVLTVQMGNANSHKKKGWEEFTDLIIEKVSEANKNCVFILWGSPAHKKEKLIDSSKHLVLKSVHPSPLSSYRGFFGSRPFSKANHYLEKKKRKPISW